MAGGFAPWQSAPGVRCRERRTPAGKRRRRAKRTVRRRSRRVACAGRIEATLADLAHEIRTPLTGILALGELLATSGLGERERGWANAIKSTAEHLAHADLADRRRRPRRRQGPGAAARADPAAPARRGARSVARRRAPRPKGSRTRRTIASDLPAAVIGDPLRLRAALENLIDNAVKFTERGSVRLEVTCETGGARQGAARLHGDRQRHRAQRRRRSSGCFGRSPRPTSRSRAATAAPGSASPSSSASPRRWAAISTVASAPGGGSRFRLTVTRRQGHGGSRRGGRRGRVARAAPCARSHPLRRGQSLRPRRAQHHSHRARPPRRFRRHRRGGGRCGRAGGATTSC